MNYVLQGDKAVDKTIGIGKQVQFAKEKLGHFESERMLFDVYCLLPARGHPVLRMPATTPLMLSASACCSASGSSGAAWRRRRSSSTCIRFSGST